MAKRTQQHVRVALSNSMELRTVFHGPPMRLLQQLYQELAADGGIEAVLPSGDTVYVPVLLQIEHPGTDFHNPPIGASGECDENHLLDLRNSPAAPRFVALVPPGQQRILSVASAT